MQTNDTTTVEQAAALHSSVPALQGLAALLAGAKAEQVEALEKFASDARLQKLAELAESQRSEFDALDFVGRLRLGSGRALWSDEEFHSNLLAWLLDSGESHSVGARFLASFLHETGASSKIQDADWLHASVIREWEHEHDGKWGYLDILILNGHDRTLCAIENKVFSSEHSEQLTRYRKALADRYLDYDRHHVFLTRRGDIPNRKKERERWTSATYATVLNIVQQLVDDNDHPVKEDVRQFLQQYATTLRRNIVPDTNTNISELARQIYLEHRDAIELIYRHKPDFIREAKEEFKKAINRRKDWNIMYDQSDHLDFSHESWDGLAFASPNEPRLLRFHFDWRWDGAGNWSPDKVRNYPRMGLVLPPETDANREARQALHRTCLQHADTFAGAQSWNSSWLYLLFTEPILNESDYVNWQNQDVIRSKIEAWVKNFAEKEFPAMNEVIVNCLREYETEQSGG